MAETWNTIKAKLLATVLSDGNTDQAPDVNTVFDAIPVKCTGAEITTGTNDTKFATPKALADANIINTLTQIRNSLFSGLTDQYLPYHNSGSPATLVDSPAYVDGNGHLVLNAKNLVVSSGNGIDFSATSDATGKTSELLDDYEEGSCTLTLTFGGNSVGITYDSRTGYYTRIGDLVTVGAYFAISSKGSSTGTALITGLPFTSAGIWFGTASFSFLYGITFTDIPTMHVQAGEAYMSLRQNGTTELTNASFANSSGFIFTISYKAA